MGFYFLAALILVVVIVYWAWRNDAAPLDGKTTGPLRMRTTGRSERAGASSADSLEIPPATKHSTV